MAYIRPLVMVFQEYAKLSISTPSSSLNPCVVGPCFHLVDPYEDEILAFAGDLDDQGMFNAYVPNNYAGAEILPETVRFRIKDMVVDMQATPYISNGVALNKISFADAAAMPPAQVGDYLTIYEGDAATEGTLLREDVRVTSIDAENFTVSINAALNSSAVSFRVHVARDAGEMELTAEDTAVSLDAGDELFSISPLTISVDGATRSVIRAKVYVGYKSLRKDLTSVKTLYSVDEIEGVLGRVTPDNPLAMAVAITLANTNTLVKCIGVTSDDVVGYVAAKDQLENAEDIYSVVPLSQRSDILAIFKAHAEQMSLPENGKWRVCIGSTPMMTTYMRQDGIGTLTNNDDGIPVIIQDENAAFMSNGVEAGQTFMLYQDEEPLAAYTVAMVISDDLLLLDVTEPIPSDVMALGDSAAYKIFEELDKTQQAELIRATSTSFASSRFIHTWPDTCIIDDEEVPGYYLSCTIAGMTAGLPSHQGFTRISVAGIQGLKFAGDYFNQSQLDKIADGGTFIFVQASPEAPPHVRHQLTTDMSTLEFRELSFVKNFDYVSYICKDVMDKFLGRYNITPSTLATLETALRATLESLRLYSLPRIGSPVINFDVSSVAQLDDIRDRVEIHAEVDFPYALNTIGLHLISR